MVEEKRETVGKIALDLKKGEKDNTHSATEQMEEQLTDYEKNIHECVDRTKKLFPKDFYVIVTTKKERLMDNVIRNYFFGRLSCPTPEYDQAVYKYTRSEDKLEFLWVIPAKDICAYFVEQSLLVHESQKELLNYVLRFTSGDLLKLSKKLNKED